MTEDLLLPPLMLLLLKIIYELKITWIKQLAIGGTVAEWSKALLLRDNK